MNEIDDLKAQIKPNLPQEILALLRKYAEEDNGEYCNPYFIQKISALLDSYYNLEDDVVDKWIDSMFGA